MARERTLKYFEERLGAIAADVEALAEEFYGSEFYEEDAVAVGKAIADEFAGVTKKLDDLADQISTAKDRLEERAGDLSDRANALDSLADDAAKVRDGLDELLEALRALE